MVLIITSNSNNSNNNDMNGNSYDNNSNDINNNTDMLVIIITATTVNFVSSAI